MDNYCSSYPNKIETAFTLTLRRYNTYQLEENQVIILFLDLGIFLLSPSCMVELIVLTTRWGRIRPLTVCQALYGQTSANDHSEVAITGVINSVQVLERAV